MTKLRNVVVIFALASALGINLAAYIMNTSAQTTQNRAGLVIQSTSGQITTSCVTFSEPEINGYDLLHRSNLPLIVDIASGGMVCKIQSTGCNYPTQKCFCECQDMNQSCVYWIYYIQTGGAWKYSPLGAFGQKVTNGSVNGWAYGAGGASSGGVMPPVMTIDQICGAAAVTAPATTAATAVPQPTLKLTSTPIVTSTASLQTAPVMSSTVVAVTVTPTATPTPSSTSTSVVIAAAEQLPSTTPVIATIEPTATLTPTPESAAPPQPNEVNTTGYVVFGIVSVILVGLLLITRAGAHKEKP